MKRRHLLLTALGVIILVIHVIGWGYVINTTFGSSVTELPKPEVVASSLSDMLLSAEINLQRSLSLSEAVTTLSGGLGGTAVDPFLARSTEASGVKAGASQPKVASAAGEAPQPVDGTELILKGMILAQSQPLVLINDNLYRIGDKIGSFQVVAIENGKVLLSSPGISNVTLKLKGLEELE